MTGLLRAVAALSPRDPTSPDELDAALVTIDADVEGATLVAVADGLSVVLFGCLFFTVALAPTAVRPAFLFVGIGVVSGAWWAVVRAPTVAARARRRRALGSAPWLVCRAAMRVQVTPTVEAAAEFAARDADDLLSRRLAAHVRRVRGTSRSGFKGFCREWGDRLPALRRGVRLVESAAVAPRGERADAAGRALDAVLEGTRDTAQADAAELRGPVTAVYAFGVLLPLALVAALPAARVAGLPITVTVLIVSYDVLLPLALVVAAAWLVARRPVAFPPTVVPRSHPDVPDRTWPSLVGGAVAGAGGSVLATLVAPAWSPPLVGVGAGVGTAFAARFRHERGVRERVRSVEADLPEVLYRVGRAVAAGRPVEAALAEVADEMDGPTADLVAAANARMHRLDAGVSDAFLGDYGVLETVPSTRTRGVARLFATAAREGRPAGDALVAAGDHLSDLQTVEQETRRSVRRATATMGNTAAVFAPLVGGVTVALGGRIGSSKLGGGLPPEALGPVVGCYVLLLAAILTALATGLERGFDRALVGYRVGLATLAATVVYVAATVGGGYVA